MYRGVYSKGFLRIKNLKPNKIKMRILASKQKSELFGFFVEMLDKFIPKKLIMIAVNIKEFSYSDLMNLSSSNDENLRLAIKALHELGSSKLLSYSKINLIEGILIRTDGEVFLDGLESIPISILHSDLHDKSVYVVHKPYTMDMIIEELLESDLLNSLDEKSCKQSLNIFYEENFSLN